MNKKLMVVAIVCAMACEDVTGFQTNGTPYAQRSSAGIASVDQRIPGRYIVTLKDDVREVDVAVASLVAPHGGRITHTYRFALKGFAAELSGAAALALARDTIVTRVEADRLVTADGTQSGAGWGLDRVDQHWLPLDSNYSYAVDGAGVTVYVIDTGINFAHVDFGGRAITGVDEVSPGGTAADCNGHGTHVSGIIGGETYGVAKNVKLVSVRVLNCAGSGSTSDVIAGIDWITANRILPSVANMSLGGAFSATLNQAVAKSVAAGIVYTVAAGNNGADACSSSPSSEASAVTVGATDVQDAFAYFSNYGSCVDLNAPGVNITSDWYSTNTATNTISGTSMAAPYVAGVAAMWLAVNPSSTPSEATSALITNATSNVVTGVPAGTANLLLYSGFIGGASPPPASSSASFTYTCSGRTCMFDATPSTGATSFAWNFGDQSSGKGATVSHVFKQSKSYKVVLTTTPTGTKSTATGTIVCGPKMCT